MAQLSWPGAVVPGPNPVRLLDDHFFHFPLEVGLAHQLVIESHLFHNLAPAHQTRETGVWNYLQAPGLNANESSNVISMEGLASEGTDSDFN